ncbi:AAA family ATPase [candidate division WOR-3 bacterium]|nr:AAA family ATPase [candidate division WOR-3 bacterium]
MAKRIFIAATGRDAGKTSISLGLIKSLLDKGHRVGYIKPIAQRYIKVEDYAVAEDVLLIKGIFNLKGNLTDMSPYIVEKGFTSKYITGNLRSPKNKILKAYRKIEKESDVVVIEGTGHAGVGSVFSLSNATVARLLNAPVLIISEGGIGSTIDRITLNHSLFTSNDCTILGVIVNKVKKEKYDEISNLLKKGIKQQNDLEIFGFVPYKSILSVPTLSRVREVLNLEVLNEGNKGGLTSGWNEQIEEVIIATMEPHVVMETVSNAQGKVLITTSSDRSDILLAALALYHSKVPNLVGVLLSGGIPPKSIMDVLKKTDLPIMLAEQNVYSIASLIHNLRVKITQEDETKINILTDLFSRYIDREFLYDAIFEPPEIKLTWKERFRDWLSEIGGLILYIIRSIFHKT